MSSTRSARRASTRADGRATRPAKPARPRAVQRAVKSEAPPSRHRRELAAIACVALAVFLAFVLYLGWDGGTLGRWLGGALTWLVGLLALATPLLLCYVAYAIAAGEEHRPRTSLSIGLALLVAGFLVAAAADTFGMFGGSRPEGLFADTYMEDHGGALGEGSWALLHPFIGGIGVDVVVLALWAGGVLLVTGSSLGLWAERSRAGVSQAGRAARVQAQGLGERRRAPATRIIDPGDDVTAALDPSLAATALVASAERADRLDPGARRGTRGAAPHRWSPRRARDLRRERP